MNQATTTLQAMLTSQHFTASPPFNYLAFTHSTTSSITSTHRTSITEWCYSIASSLELQNESVRNGMRYLDRYLSSGNGKSNECLKNQVLFQLAGITCFWVAVKMGEESVMRLDVDFLVKVCCVGWRGVVPNDANACRLRLRWLILIDIILLFISPSNKHSSVKDSTPNKTLNKWNKIFSSHLSGR